MIITKHFLAAILVLPILAASSVRAGQQEVLAKGKADWFALRTSTAECELIQATLNPETASEAHYWLGRIYEFKGTNEGAFPGFHEEIAYRARAAAEFAAAGTPKPEWIAEGDKSAAALKAADAAITAIQADVNSSAAALRAAIETRIKIRPDPSAYSSGANMMVARNADLPFVLQLAAEGKAAGEQFIRENAGSYKLDGKVQASIDRNAATFADIAGWALYLRDDIDAAEQQLAEAARLFRNNDVTNQLHLALLSARRGDLETAEDHYLNVMDLADSGTDGLQKRAQARIALIKLRETAGENEAEARAWMVDMLDRKREQRRAAATSSMLGRELPSLVLKDLQGNDVNLRAQHGNVVLLNFFAAW